MQPENIATTLHNFRAHTKTVDDLQVTLEKIAGIGYENIEVSAAQNVPPATMRKACEALGLTIVSTHIPSTRVLEEPAAVIAYQQELGVDLLGYPAPKGYDCANPTEAAALLEKLREVQATYAQAGITLFYHNHAFEFRKSEGKIFYERLFEETTLPFQMDAFWVQRGGASPHLWAEKLGKAGRLPLLHCKDFKILADDEIRFGEIGQGNIEFAPLIATAEAHGCKYFIVEQDQWYDRDPFDCAADSYAALRALCP